jgi:prepilin-type N-terminal cleavage/methylation domain-containing protein
VTARRKDSRGFTLMEMMVVLAIIGAVVSVAAPRWGNSIQRSRERQCLATRHTIEMTEARYVSDTTGGSASVAALYAAGYLQKDAICTAGGEYVWAGGPSSANSRYVVCSVHGYSVPGAE